MVLLQAPYVLCFVVYAWPSGRFLWCSLFQVVLFSLSAYAFINKQPIDVMICYLFRLVLPIHKSWCTQQAVQGIMRIGMYLVC